MTGPDLQHEWKLRCQGIAVVFITANRNETLRARMLDSGTVDCRFKPFSDTALLEALKWRTRRNRASLWLSGAPGEYTMKSAPALGQEVESSPLSRAAQIGFVVVDDSYEGIGDSITQSLACTPGCDGFVASDSLLPRSYGFAIGR
jgi:DNA-binding response OmpR family regulator